MRAPFRQRRNFASLRCLPALLGCLTVLVGCAQQAKHSTQAAPSAKHLRILQVNDTYKIEGLERGAVGGFARLRTLRRQLEQDGGPILLLHAGDFLYPSVMSKYLAAQPIIKIMNLLDGDADAFDPNMIVTFGNHEFDNSDPGVLLGRIAQSDFNWVSSNVRYRSSPKAPAQDWEPRLPVPKRLVREINGIKVGVFALTLDSGASDYVAISDSPAERRQVAKEAIKQLQREGAEVIIALTHQDLEQDQWLAREFPGISLIVGGHEHYYIKDQVGTTWITKADADNRSAILHQLTFEAGAAPKVQSRRVPLDSSVPQDPLLLGAIAGFEKELAIALAKASGRNAQTIVGKTVHALEGLETDIRSRETALGNFLADCIRQRMDTDLAFVNGGGIRINDTIPPGPVTLSDLEGLFYFEDRLVSFAITGHELLELLRLSVAKAHLGHGGFLQVSGLRFRYHREGAEGNPSYRVEPTEVWIQGRAGGNYRPLKLGGRYTAASTDFIWANGFQDGYELFQHGKGGSSPPRLDRGVSPAFRRVVEDILTRLPNQTITSRIEGRIAESTRP